MKIAIKRLTDTAVLPTYAHGSAEDAGMDLYADHDATLFSGVPTLVKTGIAIELPPRYEAQVRARGSLALKHGIQVVNSPGTVDPGYRGDIGVILVWNGYKPNDTHYYSDKPVYSLKKGDRIAQLVIARYEPVTWEEASSLSHSDRGVGAYGSTGK